ncbi:hypothetical protein RFI_38676 [Reticulomyxa filosa]|uniref:Uncharacterized protein n=1 Tax=Reticulomyxa filosa TaxID=46433 RepID=X6LBS3_RETFI|nr:hypothetical protein RFI_38676 [Reticulomyxa filosa]|eukprot:ETN98810.1 hypothetical protein RFI_38676 [Reticulomyxa filosa]
MKKQMHSTAALPSEQANSNKFCQNVKELMFMERNASERIAPSNLDNEKRNKQLVENTNVKTLAQIFKVSTRLTQKLSLQAEVKCDSPGKAPLTRTLIDCKKQELTYQWRHGQVLKNQDIVRFWDIRSNKNQLYVIKGDEDSGIICVKFSQLKRTRKRESNDDICCGINLCYGSYSDLIRFADSKHIVG